VTVSDARLHYYKELKSRFESLEDITEEMHLQVDTQRPIKENLIKILSHDYGLLSKAIDARSKDHL